MVAVSRAYSPKTVDRTVSVFPPALSLATVRDALASRSDVLLGGQNIHSEPKERPGENSAAMRAMQARVWVWWAIPKAHVFGNSRATRKSPSRSDRPDSDVCALAKDRSRETARRMRWSPTASTGLSLGQEGSPTIAIPMNQCGHRTGKTPPPADASAGQTHPGELAKLCASTSRLTSDL